jgi:hypothetical protein
MSTAHNFPLENTRRNCFFNVELYVCVKQQQQQQRKGMPTWPDGARPDLFYLFRVFNLLEKERSLLKAADPVLRGVITLPSQLFWGKKRNWQVIQSSHICKKLVSLVERTGSVKRKNVGALPPLSFFKKEKSLDLTIHILFFSPHTHQKRCFYQRLFCLTSPTSHIICTYIAW